MTTIVERPTKWNELEAAIAKIVKGEIEPPNQEPMTNDKAVDSGD